MSFGRGREATKPAWMTAGQGTAPAPGTPMGGGMPAPQQPFGGPGQQQPQQMQWQAPGQMGGPPRPGGMPMQPPQQPRPGFGGPPGPGWQQQGPPQPGPPRPMGAMPPQQGMMPHQQMPPQSMGGFPPQPQAYGGPMGVRPNAVSGASSFPGARPAQPAQPAYPGMQGPAVPSPMGGTPQRSAAAGGQMAPGWTEHTAPDGRKYYFNKASGKSVWEKPLADAAATPVPKVEPAKKASDWKEFTAPDGRKYYYNSSTKVSSWTMPDELKKGSDTPSAVKASPAAHGTPSVQVVKLEGVSAGSGTPTAAQNGMPAFTPMKQEESKPEVKQGTPQGTPAQMDAGKYMYATKDEAKDAFKELLASVHCNSDWSWEQTMRQIIGDPRYSALKSLGEKKACFNEYTQQRKKDEVLERRLALKKAREDFNTMLEECVDLSVGMRLSKAAQILEDDPRWKAAPSAERESLFEDFMKEKEKKAREAKKAERKRRMAAFRELLENTKSIKVDTPWRKAVTKVEVDDEYQALNKLDRLEVFQEYILHLEKQAAEEKEKERQERRRKERKNRDAFMELLQRHLSEGVIVARMRWKDYEPLIRKEDVLKAVEKNVAGSRPKEMFEEVLETADKQFEKDKVLLKDLIKEHSISVELDSTFEDFCSALNAHESAKLIANPNKKLVFDELLARLKDKVAKEEKRKRRAREDFTALLKDTRDIKADMSWEDAQPLLEKQPEYKGVEAAEREELFKGHMAYLEQRRERELEREREREKERELEAEEAGEKRKKRHKEKKDRHRDEDDRKHRKSKRHADEEEEGSEDKKSKRTRKDKERERRRSAPAAEGADAGTPRRDGAEPLHVDAAEEPPSSGGKSDGEL